MGKGKDRGKHVRDGASKTDSTAAAAGRVGDLLRVGPGFELSAIDPERVVVGPDDREAARAEAAALEPEAAELHERLWAASKEGGERALLVVLQGMDTSGKGGAAKAIDRLLDPLGFAVVGFGVPTDEEKAHGFLWRHERQLPEPGRIRLFDRSHYEAVLVERVRRLVPEAVWAARYDEINRWEAELATRGITTLKLMLHISRDEQRGRLLDRLDDPTKHWKYNPRDVDERALWDDYQAAYQDALVRCSTDVAPWYVIPANHKWRRDWCISHVLVETLRAIAPPYPPADFDVETERARVEAS